MGLDIWLFKIRKTKKDLSNVKTLDDIRQLGLNSFTEKGVKPSYMYDDLIPYCVEVMCENDYIDIDKIKKTYGLEDIYSESIGGIYSFVDKNGKKISLTSDEIKDNFTVTRQEATYVFEEENVYYWRKRYDIQDLFYESYQVENCGYTEVDIETLEHIQKEYDEGLIIPELGDDEAVFYHEWY